jgi:predicted metal-binding protein
MLSRTPVVLTSLLLAGAAAMALAGDKVKLKPQVTYAKTWEAAVQEAKDLNVPIVVHSHGFY